MVMHFDPVLSALRAHTAVPAFNVPYLPMVEPVVRVVQIDDPLMGYEVHMWIDDYSIAPRVRSDRRLRGLSDELLEPGRPDDRYLGQARPLRRFPVRRQRGVPRVHRRFPPQEGPESRRQPSRPRCCDLRPR